MAPELRPQRMAFYRGAVVKVIELIFHDAAVIDMEGTKLTVKRRELLPMADPEDVLGKTDVAAVPSGQWDPADTRAGAIRLLLSKKSGRTAEAQKQASALGISERQFWRLVSDYKLHETVSGLIRQAPGRKAGTTVLDPGVERVIAEKIDSYYLQPERPTVTALHERIAVACREQSLQPPTRATVAKRVRNYETRAAQRRRIGSKKAKYLYEAMPGHVKVSARLERVEIDHTPMDVMVRSDDPYCDYIGRPWLTVAIDVYTRCILGIHIGFEPPSILSVALCLTHAVLPKVPAAEFGVPLDWPMQGLPREIVVDNGKDFVSAAFKRGCMEHGIVLCYRPVGSPHYGGSIERLIGTMVGQCHLLPGTTKNSVKAKGEYDSAKHAVLTLRQARTWFVEQLLGRYHVNEHRMIRIPPIEMWKRAAEGDDAAAQ
ncbi:DDE-type integrase/transposase/recombinase [Rhodanobacter sp. 7MK24]|uniref:DDE-type integrase/transposase/recombinase n=1 Tax=Rhodanobacter sp. 7MK24 TaxID=2775922 RepID=UPI00177C4723|nr:DDE-type integrase/transposase/recombinase [Rhodanobacter sp. 7MK24]MBD8879795.1 DDE-type integrase/transposase/recombinase [Rhodanobacter sp. 7MK24]